MIQKEIEITNAAGLHARPAAVFVKTAKQFQSKITVKLEEREADAKSMLRVLALGADKGKTVLISAEGEDETQALQALEEVLQMSFD